MRMVSLVDGLAVSSLALGTMTFGKEADEATSHAMLDHTWHPAATSSTPQIAIPWEAVRRLLADGWHPRASGMRL